MCIGSLATGTVLGWTGNIGKELEEGQHNGLVITTSTLGWIGSFANLGAMMMCFPIGILCDKLGRKLANLLLTIPFIVGWLLIIFAKSIAMLYVGRFVTGMAGGAFCVSAPLYTSEISQKEIRGTLGSFFQLFLTVGILLSYILGYAVHIKTLNIVVAVIPLLFCVAFLFQPETPIYKMKQKKEDEARDILIRLRGKSYDVDSEIQEIKAALEEAERNQISITDSLSKRSTRIAGIVCFSLMFFQQASGVNAVIFYTSNIFISAGSTLDPKEATMIVGGIQVIATLASSIVIDLLGRRILLLASDFFMAIGLAVIGAFFTLKDHELVSQETIEALGIMPIIGLSIFMIVFSLGYGPIPWMISSELFPSEIKSTASAAAGTFNWFMAFLITKFYNDLQLAIGGDITFYIFMAVCIVGTVFVFFVVPETKGKSLEQIQKELNREIDHKPSGFENHGYSM